MLNMHKARDWLQINSIISGFCFKKNSSLEKEVKGVEAYVEKHRIY